PPPRFFLLNLADDLAALAVAFGSGGFGQGRIIIGKEGTGFAFPVADNAARTISKQLNTAIAQASAVAVYVGFVPATIGGHILIDDAHLGARDP
ncbi:MAG: hypothetical protein KDC53_25765, partial [Saprospiraceae bacterium]|nr:hypothetical protein [Saprospiraceae bacterium]